MAGVFWGGFGKSYFTTNKITSKFEFRALLSWNVHVDKLVQMKCKMSTIVHSKRVGGQNWVKLSPRS